MAKKKSTNQDPKPAAERLVATSDTRTIPVSEILADSVWNTRREATDTGTDDSNAPDQALLDSIREHGLISPIAVTEIVEEREDGKRYALVAGFRRFAALLKLGVETAPAVVISRGRARLVNLAENALRVTLRPWERAESLHRAKQEDPALTNADLAVATGLDDRYVGNLIRLRTKLCQDLWDEYVKKGESMRQADHVADCKHPNGGEGGEVARKGGDPADLKQVRRWLKEVDAALGTPDGKAKEEFLLGVKYALRCVNGNEVFALTEEVEEEEADE